MKLRSFVRTLWFFFVLSTGQPASSQTSASREDSPPPALKYDALNRTVLSVGNDVYTAFDIEVLLRVWNLLGTRTIRHTTNWMTITGFPLDKDKDLADNIAAWPPDAARLLFITLVWSESRRLSLFVPGEKELDAAMQKLRKGLTSEGMRPAVAHYFGALSGSRLREYADMCLRARTSERIRGDLKKNATLMSVPWFWHGRPSRRNSATP